MRTNTPIYNVHYLGLRLGDSSRPRYLVIGRSSNSLTTKTTTTIITSPDGKTATASSTSGTGSAGFASFDAIYFDADADGAVTANERIETVTYQAPVYGVEREPLLLWITRPVKPLQVEVRYARADGTSLSGSLTFSLEVYAYFEQVSLEGQDIEKLLANLKKPMNPLCYAKVILTTWFIGEVVADGDRVLKVAIIDGNKNGFFKEAIPSSSNEESFLPGRA